VAKFNYLGEKLSNEYRFSEEIKNILELGKSCYRSVQFALKKYEGQNMQKHNFAFCFIWVGNLVSHIEEGTLAESVGG
jgi:hypothetical protein